MKKLVVDPVVAAILGPSQVSQIADAREHTQAACAVCGGPIPPEDPAPVTVLLGVSEDTVLYIQLAHEKCAPSHVYDIERELLAPGLHAELSFVAYPILRAPPVVPRAMIVFEFASRATDERGADLRKQAFLRRGWEPVTDSFDRVTAAALESLCVRLDDDQIVVEDEDLEIIAFSSTTAPPGWWEAGQEQGCLVLYGSGLGLERFNVERLNMALQASACVAATARVDLAARPERVIKVEQVTVRDGARRGLGALLGEGDDHREIVEQATQLFAYAHVRLVTGYFSRYKRDPLADAKRKGLSAAQTADRVVQEVAHSPEGKLLFSFVEANRGRIGRAVWNAVENGGDPYAAVAAWVEDHEVEAYAEVRTALRQ